MTLVFGFVRRAQFGLASFAVTIAHIVSVVYVASSIAYAFATDDGLYASPHYRTAYVLMIGLPFVVLPWAAAGLMRQEGKRTFAKIGLIYSVCFIAFMTFCFIVLILALLAPHGPY